MSTNSPSGSAGSSTADDRVRALTAEAHERFRSVSEGKVADYIPALAATPAELFGVCMIGTSGATFAAGDSDYEFSIQSVSKPFVFALVCQAVGEDQHGATHSWTEIYIPGAGWRGFDPTNNKPAGDEHVSVAVAREHDKASPLSGSWQGPSDAWDRLEVSVQVVAL